MFKPPRVALKKWCAHFFAKPVSRAVAEYRGEREEWKQNPNIEIAVRGEKARREEHAAPRKEEAKEDAALQKYCKKESGIADCLYDRNEIQVQKMHVGIVYPKREIGRASGR